MSTSMPAELTVTLEQPVMVNEISTKQQNVDIPNPEKNKLPSGSHRSNDNPALVKEKPFLVETESESSSLFLPGTVFSDNSTSEEDGGFFIEDDYENDIKNHQDDDDVRKEETDCKVLSKVQLQQKQQDEACDEPTLLPTPPSTMAATSFPTRSILKADVEEEIPINTKKNKWSKLPVPDMEYVKMKRIESLNSIVLSRNNSTPDLASLSNIDDQSPAENPKVLKRSDSRVKFQHIVVREYQQTIGDNPSVAYGAPISLDWEYRENEPLDVDSYEGTRGNARRNEHQMRLTSYQRKKIFVKEYGFTEEEVKAARKATNKVRSQREWSKMMHTSMESWLILEEMRESAVRKFRRYRKRNNIEPCDSSIWIENMQKERRGGINVVEEGNVEDPASVKMRRVQSAPILL